MRVWDYILKPWFLFFAIFILLFRRVLRNYLLNKKKNQKPVWWDEDLIRY